MIFKIFAINFVITSDLVWNRTTDLVGNRTIIKFLAQIIDQITILFILFIIYCIITYIVLCFCLFRFKKKITPILVSFDEQNDNLQTQPQTQLQTQSQTQSSAHRQQATFQHVSQQSSYGNMMSSSGAGGWDPALNTENLWQFPQQYSEQQRPRSMPETR